MLGLVGDPGPAAIRRPVVILRPGNSGPLLPLFAPLTALHVLGNTRVPLSHC